ncbi:hypothetical protein [Frigoriglobus tundricola]|uniref:Uncharacterized protein n=1 Tax=Frigoriglobus tundricola TaxID=2774151 RepID=A0A6M5YJU1_9BACT|nr:hypothetical protein [Frigoriglobus tundricola]QJW93834.1 hypothetical protein FTUN_1346 [Frigoriglobus tundricola]
MAKAKPEVSEAKVTQIEMVRAALEEFGPDAKPQPMQTFILEKFNTELAPNIISNYKSVLKRKGGGAVAGIAGGRRGRKSGAQFSDLETIRGLVTRLGAEQVKKLVDVAGMFS